VRRGDGVAHAAGSSRRIARAPTRIHRPHPRCRTSGSRGDRTQSAERFRATTSPGKGWGVTMKAKRATQVRGDGDEPRRAKGPTTRKAKKRSGDAPPRRRKPTREQRPQRPQRSAPQTGPIPRPTDGPVRAKNASQAKARAKARKAKAPKVVRAPLRQRLLVKVASIDLNPRTLVARVPFVVLVIGSLGMGLGVTLWLSTDAAERSYQLGSARNTNQALLQQKEALERDVLEAQAAPALAESARELGMIPSRDTAH